MAAQAIDIQANIKKAIGSHGMWKTRLQEAIASGKSEFTVSGVSADNNCDFGKWLRGDLSLRAGSAHYDKVRQLHAEFHKEVARILGLALAGKKAEALKAMESKTPYVKLSSDLTSEMMAWARD